MSDPPVVLPSATTSVPADPAEGAASPRGLGRMGGARLGLGSRITFAFAIGAALLSALLASTTWALTRENIVNQRESSATRQAFRNAGLLEERLSSGSTDDESVREYLLSLQSDSPSRTMLLGPDGSRINPSTSFDRQTVPDALAEMVAGGRSARLRVISDGQPHLLIGVPLTVEGYEYFELFSLAETQSTLESLSISLFGASLVTILAGAALGYWLTRRTLRPLADVSQAAEAIAGGRLDTRLSAAADADLGVLVRSFNHMAEVLESRIDRDGRFASDVSHELRSPLMTLSASIEVLASRRADMPDASAQAAVDLMEADVARFKQLVEDLLEISRFDAGAARLELSEVSPGELATQAVAWSQSPDVPIEVDEALEEVFIRADKRRVVRVITNLLDNARKYGGGATAVILMRLPEGLQIAVEDRGPGVPVEERDLIFDRFSRGAGSSRRAGSEGVGLGLSLVAEHVALHKGRVWVEDRRDGEPGARFVMELPVSWADQDPEADAGEGTDPIADGSGEPEPDRADVP